MYGHTLTWTPGNALIQFLSRLSPDLGMSGKNKSQEEPFPSRKNVQNEHFYIHRAQNGWHNSHCKIATGTVPCTTVRSVVEPSTRHFPCQIYLAIMQNLKKKKKEKNAE